MEQRCREHNEAGKENSCSHIALVPRRRCPHINCTDFDIDFFTVWMEMAEQFGIKSLILM
jgi:hypothetical protein